MFERYEEKSRRVIFFARYEAAQLGSPNIETEHILLGLMREDKDLAGRSLGSSASAEAIRRQIEDHTQRREKIRTSADLPLSHQCKRVLAYGAEEAERMKHQRIGTQHLLLGLLREEKSFAADMLHERGLRLPQVRAEVARSGQQPLSVSGISPSEAILDLARREAERTGSAAVETRHLLLAALPGAVAWDASSVQAAEKIFGSAEAVASLRARIEPYPAGREKVLLAEIPLTNVSKRVLAIADEERERMKDELMGPFHLLLGLLREESCEGAEILRGHGVSLEKVRAAIEGIPRGDSEEGTSHV
jgi:ATP-dependent Clp protease ATP-binding subunit ClpA